MHERVNAGTWKWAVAGKWGIVEWEQDQRTVSRGG